MFEAVSLGQKISKVEFKRAEGKLRVELLELQRQLADKKVPTLIIISGIDGAGKGEVVDLLNKWVDSRGIETHAFWDETDEEQQRPEYWRYWRRLPARGDVGIMFGGWYWDAVHDHAQGKLSMAQLDQLTNRIRNFEALLQQDGMLIIKLWCHLSEPSYKKRMKHRRDVARHISDVERPESWYQDFCRAAENLIRRTDTEYASWNLIAADDEFFRDLSIARVVAQQICHRLEFAAMEKRRRQLSGLSLALSPATVLDNLQHQALEEDKYKKQLKHYQRELRELAWQVYDARRSVVVVFEGWDASGKGGDPALDQGDRCSSV